MQQALLASQQQKIDREHLQNLVSLLDDCNRRELEKLYYTILSDAAIAFQNDPKVEGSDRTIDPGVSIVYFRRNKCPTVWKASSRNEYDILYEIVCELTQMLYRDFLGDIGQGEKSIDCIPSFL